MIRRVLHPEIYIPPQGDLVAEADRSRKAASKIVDAVLQSIDAATKEPAKLMAERQQRRIHKPERLLSSLND